MSPIVANEAHKDSAPARQCRREVRGRLRNGAAMAKIGVPLYVLAPKFH